MLMVGGSTVLCGRTISATRPTTRDRAVSPREAAARTDATANSVALAFPGSEGYNFGAVGGGSNGEVLKQIRSRMDRGDAVSGRAGRPRPDLADELLDSGL